MTLLNITNDSVPFSVKLQEIKLRYEKSVALTTDFFFNARNKLAEKETRKNIPFTTAPEKKNPGMNLSKAVSDASTAWHISSSVPAGFLRQPRAETMS